MYVTYKLQQINVSFNKDSFLVALEQVAGSRPCEIYPCSVANGNILHYTREGNCSRLDDDVNVVRHEAEAVDAASRLVREGGLCRRDSEINRSNSYQIIWVQMHHGNLLAVNPGAVSARQIFNYQFILN